jgi:carbonic anhydrase
MKKNIKVSALLALLVSTVLSANLLWSFQKEQPAAEPQSSQSVAVADETLKKLMSANQNFVSGKLTQRDLSARRAELVKGQSPSAIVLTCSDSRVAPEYIFDQGLGDIFVIRVAGNVTEPIALGSIEYAVEHLHTPLIIVMGHDSCGAVGAAVKGGEPEGNIAAIVKKISPSVDKAKATGKTGDDLLTAAIIENARSVAVNLTRDSAIIKHLVDEKKVKIVPAKYSLATGKVDLL